jgi:subtilisin-like proprotein convertase family protein
MKPGADTHPARADIDAARLVRNEILVRPARNAAIFCVLFAAAMLAFAGSADAATYTSPAPVTIAASGAATPYPAAIHVSGVTGKVTDVDVRLHGLTHPILDDLAIALQGPGGQSITLMNGVGGAAAVNAVDLTIDDEAAQPLPDASAPAPGSYRPASYYTGDSFPAPGPGTSYCNPGPSGGWSCDLASTYDGSSPLGTWRLFVHDFIGSAGSLAGGWSLELTTDGVADDRAPQTSIDSGPDGPTNRVNPSFSFSADEHATFECALDGGAFAPCSSPTRYSELAPGDHGFSVRATDDAGNVDETPATRAFTIDTTAPTAAVGKVTVRKRKATIEISGHDAGSTRAALSCALDGKPPSACTSPLVLNGLKRGRHTIVVTARDRAGNESAPASAKFKVKKRRR